jgi:tetratricopeptide (TPR) repeat protein
MEKLLFIVFLSLAASYHAYSQNSVVPNAAYVRPLSAGDSLLLNRYVEGADKSPIFSQRRQHYLDSALTIMPWKAYWWQQKAMPLFKQQKYEAGMPYLDSAVKYDSRKYVDYRAFMKCIFQKSYRASIRDFELAKSVIGAGGAVMDHSYDFYLGLCYLQLNQFDSAEYFLVKTINEQKRSIGDKWVNPVDWFYLGIVYYEQEYSKAGEIFDNCLKLYANFSDAKYYKAVCLEKLNKHEQAVSLMKEAGDDFQQGYSITDINAMHEAYPYQVNKHYFSKI